MQSGKSQPPPFNGVTMPRRPLESTHVLSTEDDLKVKYAVELLKASIVLAGGSVTQEELLESTLSDVLRFIIPNGIEVRFRPTHITGF